MHRNRLQLVGIAALFTASKTEVQFDLDDIVHTGSLALGLPAQEIYPPTLREFGNTGAGAYTSEDIKRQESIMIKVRERDTRPRLISSLAAN